jgi:hypothetical protein
MQLGSGALINEASISTAGDISLLRTKRCGIDAEGPSNVDGSRNAPE